MTRRRSRDAETEDVVPRRLKRGAIKRVHVAPWAIGREHYRPGSIDETHLGPRIINETHIHPTTYSDLAGAGQLLVMSATGDTIVSGGDYATFGSIVAQYRFDSVTNAGASWTHPIDGVYILIYEHAWDSYNGGGTIVLELDGDLVPGGKIADGSVGREGRGSIAYFAEAGQVGKIKVTQTSGADEVYDGLVRVAITDPTTGTAGLSGPATIIGPNVVSLGTQSAPDTASWSGYPAGWSDTSAHWIWHTALDGGGGRPNGEQAWLQGIVTVGADQAVDIEAACDNSATLYLNGVLLGAVPTYTSTSTFSATLTAGENQFTASCANTSASGGNPAGFIMSARDASTSAVVIRTTDAGGWYGATTEPAGWPAP